MAYSHVAYTGDGTNAIFNIPFPFLKREFITVNINGIQQPPEDIEWLTDASIRLVKTPPAGSSVLIFRDTAKDKAVVGFRDGSVLTERALDDQVTQLLHITQEVYDVPGQLQSTLEGIESVAQEAADQARLAGEKALLAQEEADRARAEADRATNMANIGPAKADKLGFVKIGEGIAVTEDGTITVTPVSLATPEKAGTVRPGTGMTVEDSGTLNIAYWDAFPPYVPIPVWGVTFGGSDGRRAIMPGEAEAREDWLLCDGGSDGKGGVMPDLLGRTIIGASASETEGTMGGSATHTHAVTGSVSATTLSTEQMPSHTHHIQAKRTNNLGTSGAQTGDYEGPDASFGSGGSGGSGSHTHELDSATALTASSYMPYCAINFIMKII